MVDATVLGSHAGRIAVVIPCYRVREQILSVLQRIGPDVDDVFVVDDACPEGSGAYVLAACADPRVTVLFHEKNQGVGGAVMTGYCYAVESGAQIVVRLDGDGQMDPKLIPYFVAPIVQSRADFVKGNRFHNVEDVRGMPFTRLLGNAALSFMTKLSSGYWHIFDPNNGYTAIRSSVLQLLPLEKISRRYFFESDFLFRLGTVQACVLDLPMAAIYGDQSSGLVIRKVFLEFLRGNLKNTFKRVLYNYFLRGFSIASVELLSGLLLTLLGFIVGVHGWAESIMTGLPATTGTVMLAALPVILGMQLLLSFLAFDIAASPKHALFPLLAPRRASLSRLAAVMNVERCNPACNPGLKAVTTMQHYTSTPQSAA
jgi:glycosyltransferase involved in cell wall biosynthesis